MAAGLATLGFAARSRPFRTFQRRNGYGAFRIPPIFQAIPDCRRLFAAESVRPFRQCMSDAIHRQQMVISPIIALCLQVGPSAVVRRVIAVYINTVDRMIGRAWTHVREKMAEISSPSFAHLNATTAVVFVRLGVLVVAAPLYFAPGIVLARVLGSVHGCAFHRDLDSVAATTVRDAEQHGTARNLFYGAAIAATDPAMQTCAFYARKHQQPTEASSNQINPRRHSGYFTNNSAEYGGA